jgi:sugar/nucleoside kinase (ribokinase family)
MKKGIIATGNWIVDFVKIIDAYPTQDALANIISQWAANGGSPYNILKDLVKLQADFPLYGVGLVGEDSNGNYIINECNELGINTSGIKKTTLAATSYTDVMTVKETGRRTFFHQRGANALLDRAACQLENYQAKIFHLGYLLLLDKLDEIDEKGRTQASYLFEHARSLGFKVSADVVSESSDRFKTVVPPALPYIDYLFINEYEATKTTGIETVIGGEININKAIEAAKKLLEMGVKDTVFLHFPKGALAVKVSGEVVKQGSVKVPQALIKGANGAGDAFAAGVLLGMHQDWDLQKTLQLAVCSAATSLFDASCSDGVQSVEKALAIGNTYGFQAI